MVLVQSPGARPTQPGAGRPDALTVSLLDPVPRGALHPSVSVR